MNETLHSQFCAKNTAVFECCEKPLTLQSIFAKLGMGIKMFPESSAAANSSSLTSHPKPPHSFSYTYSLIYWYSFGVFALITLVFAIMLLLKKSEPRPILMGSRYRRHRRFGHASSSFFEKRNRSKSPRRTLV